MRSVLASGRDADLVVTELILRHPIQGELGRCVFTFGFWTSVGFVEGLSLDDDLRRPIQGDLGGWVGGLLLVHWTWEVVFVGVGAWDMLQTGVPVLV